MNQGERITAVETRLQALEKKVDKIDEKLDELLALRNKGAGVFWLSSVLFGSTLAATITYVLSWFKGV